MNAQTSPSLSSTRRSGRLFLSLAAFALISSIAAAQTTDAPRRRGNDDAGGGDRRTVSPAEAQNRMLNALRERMGVTSDEEWGLIADRIQKVTEARRTMGGGIGGPGGPGGMMFAGGQRGPGGPGGPAGDRGTSGDRGTGGTAGTFRGPPRGGSPEQAALTQAVADKLPDAEIKARLTKLRETRKANEAKLEKAQDELRAVLTVRQEAQAVLLGLLN